MRNTEEYEKEETNLLSHIGKRNNETKKLKEQNEEITAALESMVQEDNELRNHLSPAKDYDEFKRTQTKLLSESKHQMVERSLHKRYNFEGMERIRPKMSPLRQKIE